MSSFVSTLPRRRWNPSQWNITRAGSTLTSILVLGACSDDTTSADNSETVADTSVTGDVTDGLDHGDYSDYSDWDNDDYSDYGDHGDYSDYSDWQDDDYSDYGDDPWEPPCVIDDDCEPGQVCIENYCAWTEVCRDSGDCPFDQFCDPELQCASVPLTSQCPAPPLQEIPLPAEAGGVAVALAFVDVDDDPAQELVILRDDAVVVIDLDDPNDPVQATTVMHNAFALDGIAATDVDEDGLVDVVATSSTKLNARVFFGDGFGGLVDSGTGPLMMLDHGYGIDWPAAGAGELLARNQADEAVILSNLAALMPEIEPLEFGVLSTVEGLAVGDFDSDTLDDVVALQGCSPIVRYQSGFLAAREVVGPVGACALGVGSYDANPAPDLAVLRSDASFTVVNVFGQATDPRVEFGLNGVYSAVQPADFGAVSPSAVLAQIGPELELIRSTGENSWCRSVFASLPLIVHFAVGDFDGDGDQELATIAEGGAVQLWTSD